MTPLEQLEQDMRDAAERARDLVSEESLPKEEYTRGERQLILEQHREVLLRWADRLSAIRAAVGGETVAWWWEIEIEYAPPATVDVGALAELVEDFRAKGHHSCATDLAALIGEKA